MEIFRSARLKALSHICIDNPYLFDDVDEEFANTSIYDELKKMAPVLDETIAACDWDDDLYWGCSKVFVPIFTEKGLCFSFNALNSNEIYTNKY